jgi:pyroglutamyl-peptidase
MRILLTAFEPFLGEKINPTMKIISHFSADPLISTIVLPVSYEKAFQRLKPVLQEGSFTDVIMLGQAAGRSLVGLERFAMNWQDTEHADEDGEIRTEQVIDNVGRGSYRTIYPLRRWLNKAKNTNLPMEISHSAGAFVCNTIYFQVSQHAHQSQPSFKSLFVHVPFLPEQVANKNLNQPSLELEKMIECVEFIVNQCKADGAIK